MRKAILLVPVMFFLLQGGTVVSVCGQEARKPAAAETPDVLGKGWIGVWKLLLEGQNKDLAYLAASVNSGKLSVQYYNRLWEPQKVHNFFLEGGKLTIDSRPNARTYRLELRLAGPAKTEGTWTLVHPQVKVTGRITGVRVLTENNWDAFEGLRAQEQPNHIIDINKFLIEKAPNGSLPEFVRFWQSEVEPRFLVLLADLLFGKDGSAEPDRTVLLKPVHQLLKKKEYRQLSVDAAKEMARVIEEIKQKHAEYYRVNPVALMPSFGGLDTSAWYFNRMVILRVPVDIVGRDYPGKALGAWLAKEQLKFVMYQFFPPVDQRLGVEVIREALAGYLALSKGFASSPDVLIALPAGSYQANVDKLGAVRQQLLANIEQADRREIRAQLGTVTPQAKNGLIVAYRFGQRVGSRYDMKQLSNMGPRRLVELLKEYLKES